MRVWIRKGVDDRRSEGWGSSEARRKVEEDHAAGRGR
jgi:hypothetical protein